MLRPILGAINLQSTFGVDFFLQSKMLTNGCIQSFSITIRRILTRFLADILVFDDAYPTARYLEEYKDDYGATEDKEIGTEE